MSAGQTHSAANQLQAIAGNVFWHVSLSLRACTAARMEQNQHAARSDCRGAVGEKKLKLHGLLPVCGACSRSLFMSGIFNNQLCMGNHVHGTAGTLCNRTIQTLPAHATQTVWEMQICRSFWDIMGLKHHVNQQVANVIQENRGH